MADSLGNPGPKKFRYEFRRIIKKGIPYIEVSDNYLAPLIVNKYLFRYEGVEEQYGYGAKMIDLILEILQGKYTTRPMLFVSYTDSMSRVKRALEELGDAMEDYDDATGAVSRLAFTSTDKKGEVFTSESNNAIKIVE